MRPRTFKHAATVFLPDPDFTALFLQPCGKGHVLIPQTWCAYLLDVENAKATRINYPAWSWNVSSSHND
ncbi:MAG TPA: hypothetical protein ENN67_03965, partial [Firmicutes bacterium]|nr:hypothetical protein [Bacillota bacterium]